ncbi:glycosyltransferase [Aequorivita sp. SDUM287046]|uniref:Glycosyltransferase n=1 Tax=Aequorivita aurantiaca TaxID=3053356 RepID=A0ABT8DF47_9FLAO|nr:glycosyltransferase [Aequorivita aurantiaca]MDN3723962.1 glycosyltransferase [Aequorivita aurantiaca]
MRILQVINSLSTGGAEKLIMESVPIYQKKGLKTDVLLLSNKKTSFWEELKLISTACIKGLTLHSIYNPFLIFRIIPYLKKYDIVHLHLFPTLYLVVLAKVLSFSNVKLIYTEHSTNNRRRSSFFWKTIDKFIYSKLAIIVTIAKEVDLNLKKHLNFPSSKFKMIHNGVDIDRFATAVAYSKDVFFSLNDFILIQVSSFRWQKDQATLIKSLKFLPLNVKLLLVGDGNLKNDCVELVKNLELEERVNFLGNRNDVPQLLITADVVVLSSKYEGLSLSNIEGMSVDKPFIGSDVPGLREIVNGYGLLFKQGDEKDLARLVRNLMNDSNFYQKTASACFDRAKNFDINTMVEEYIKLYKTVLNAPT